MWLHHWFIQRWSWRLAYPGANPQLATPPAPEVIAVMLLCVTTIASRLCSSPSPLLWCSVRVARGSAAWNAAMPRLHYVPGSSHPSPSSGDGGTAWNTANLLGFTGFLVLPWSAGGGNWHYTSPPPQSPAPGAFAPSPGPPLGHYNISSLIIDPLPIDLSMEFALFCAAIQGVNIFIELSIHPRPRFSFLVCQWQLRLPQYICEAGTFCLSLHNPNFPLHDQKLLPLMKGPF